MKKINSILVFGFLVLMMSATSLVKDVPVIKWSKMEQLIQAERRSDSCGQLLGDMV